jgi:uncharacterized RDD family membrane protein YckC
LATNAPQLTLQSITGVDVELRIAGPGSRSYAFVIDLHIRFLIAFAYLLVASFIYFGRLELFPPDADDMRPGYALWVWLPTLAIYFFYHPVLEIAMRGRTPGKRMAGVRIVTRHGDIPGAGALLVRNVFRLIDGFPGVYLVGLAVVIFTQQHVRIGDLAGGTLLVLDTSEKDSSLAALAASSSGLDPHTADLVHELLDRWKELEPQARRQIACSLVARIEPELTTPQIANLYDEDLRRKLAAAVGKESK